MILIPFTLAQGENFHNYQNMEIKIDINANIKIEKTTGNSDLDEAEAKLNFFPKETFRQKIIEMETTPSSQEKNDYLLYEWERPSGDELSFGLSSTIKTENTFPKIYNKLRFPSVSPLEYEKYIVATEFIDINEEIRNKAAEIVEGETDYFIAIYKIAEWVNRNIKYDLNTLTAEVVQKSSWVLENREGVCDELTNLFISMVRSLGIPARFVSGTVYTNNGDKFENHGWAEVYFPEYGWVPFDVTFGQYGWISPSHVKLSHSDDSGSPSVEYKWRSRGIQLVPSNLEIKAEITKKEGTPLKQTQIFVRPLNNEVAPGSYVPLEVKIKNTHNYYVPLVLTVTKAPGLEDETQKTTIIEPLKEKNVYWILKIPENAKSGYVYTSDIEVRTSFNTIDTAKIKFSKNFNEYTKKQAQEKINQLTAREEKEFLEEIDLKCTTDKKAYYNTEEETINCIIRNKGNTNIEKINVCLFDECNLISLKIIEQQEIEFKTMARETIKITAETENKIKEVTLKRKVALIPKIKVSFEPKQIDYKEKKEIIVSIKPNTEVKDLDIISNNNIIRVGNLSNQYNLKIKGRGKNFVRGIKLALIFKDQLGKEYSVKERLYPEISNIPWYASLINSFLRNGIQIKN